MATSCTNIINSSGKIIENKDGSVSVFVKNAAGSYIPYALNESCCLSLNSGYTYDTNSQKCRWVPAAPCSIQNTFKITLNPEGNDGAFFYANSNELCSLNVSFDYLFKFDCSALTNLLPQIKPTPVPVPIATTNLTSANNLINTINAGKTQIQVLNNQVSQTNAQLTNVQHSVVFNGTPKLTQTSVKVPASNLKQFTNTGFGSGTKNSGSSQNLTITAVSQTTTSTTFCLTEPDGLTAWSVILGQNKYAAFLNGDPTSYTDADVAQLMSQNDTAIANGSPALIGQCQVPFGTKSRLLKQLGSDKTQITGTTIFVGNLTNSLSGLTASTAQANTTTVTCNTPKDLFEGLDVSMTIDVVTTGNTSQTVYTSNFFPAIGNGNLYNYLVANQNATGFYVTGFDYGPILQTNCAAPSRNNFPPYGTCQSAINALITELYQESGLSGTTGFSGFSQSLPPSGFTSTWLHYSTSITDPNLISMIANNKVKISLVINHTCSDMCLYLDNIVLEKSCEVIAEQKIQITKCPGFELDKIRDNKKSWLNNTVRTNRHFNIYDVNGNNPIRQTNYDVNNEKLVINTKEIDLDINIAAAIETDVWQYIVNNPCLLTGTTHCHPCAYKQFQDNELFEFMDSYSYNFQDERTSPTTASTCCGDNQLMFNELMNQPLSAVTVVEDFEYFISSELIDAKNRQTISAYPTLRALYERYLDSTIYCGTQSAGFNYLSMDQYSGLIDSYWMDIIEQVVPSTTIWGAVKIYTNTVFDAQKFKYKAYSSLFCNNPFFGNSVLSPINGTSGTCQNIDVIMSNINTGNDLESCLSSSNITTCNSICLAQMNSGSEFIGTVSISGPNSLNCNLTGKTAINACDLKVSVSVDGLTATAYLTGAKAPISYLWSNGDTNSATVFSGTGHYNITVIDSNCCKSLVEFSIK